MITAGIMNIKTESPVLEPEMKGTGGNFHSFSLVDFLIFVLGFFSFVLICETPGKNKEFTFIPSPQNSQPVGDLLFLLSLDVALIFLLLYIYISSVWQYGCFFLHAGILQKYLLWFCHFTWDQVTGKDYISLQFSFSRCFLEKSTILNLLVWSGYPQLIH